MIRDIKKFGHSHKLMMRSDGEPAIRDLLKKVAHMRASETLLEHSPVGDSKANGRAERAVQAVEKQVRVLNISTEENLGKFSVMHPVFPWLVLHAADVMTKFKVRPDGLTAYEAIKGRDYSGAMLEFCSAVLYRATAKVQGGIMEPRWLQGIWVGKRFGSEEHIVGTAEGGVIRSSAVKPHPEKDWDMELFNAITGSPWDPSGMASSERGVVIEHQGDLPRAVASRAEPEIPQVRRVLIT